MENYKILSLIRKERNLKAKDVTKLLNINPTTLSSCEREKAEPSINVLAKLAQMFHVSLDFIVYGEGKQITLSEDDINLLIQFNIFSRVCMCLKTNNGDEINEEL